MQLSRTSVYAAPVLIGLLFLPALLGIDRLGFRDVSHFYTPLYDYVAWRTDSQWLPLWNSLDQTGMPLLGDTTTAVFYPVRYLLFSLPISTDLAISWYVVLHLILASAAARLAARWSGIGPVAATIAGVIYPLSGSVLFLYANPPFLVGAAWLPLVLGVMLARVPISTTAKIVVGGVSMSMMVLGGNPQTALHAMIVVAATSIVRLVRTNGVGISAGVLWTAPILAAALAAPQIAASISWSSQSDRIGDPGSERWMDPPQIGGKRHEAFQYSLPPWHTLELATPNAFGSLLPTYQRISQLIPGDGRMWTPSIYMGMVVLVALLGRIFWWRSAGIDHWMATVLVTLWLAMGHFGVVWLLQTTTGSLSHLDSAIGGPYWWLYQFVPEYDSFRYPAKWLTLFSLAATMVAAQSIDSRLFQNTFGRIAPWLAAVLVIAFASTMFLRWNPASLLGPAGQLPNDEFWGPLDIDAGLSQIARSLVHSAIVLMSVWIVVERCKARTWSDRTVGLWLLVIVLVDQGISGHQWIARVPRDSELQLLSQLDSPSDPTASRWMRTQSNGGWPQVWQATRDDARLLDVEASARAAWFGRWHLSDRASVLNNMVSIRSHQMALFWQATRQVTAGMSPDERDKFWSSIRRWLAIDGVVHATGRSIGVAVDGRVAQMVDRSMQTQEPGSRLRAHSNWDHDPSLTSRDFAAFLRRLADADGLSRPVVQSREIPNIRPGTTDNDAESDGTASGAEYAQFDVRLTSPTLLTRPVFQDGHWTAQYARANSSDWQPLRVHRVDHLTQGVLMPAGDWQLRFRYAPWWLPWSLGMAVISWVLTLWLAIRVWVARQRLAGG